MKIQFNTIANGTSNAKLPKQLSRNKKLKNQQRVLLLKNKELKTLLVDSANNLIGSYKQDQKEAKTQVGG